MAIRIQSTAVDALDPAATARFWSAVLGWRVTDEDEDEVAIEPPAGEDRGGVVARPPVPQVPEAKGSRTGCTSSSGPTTSRRGGRIEAHGVRRVGVGQGPDVTWVVLADPEGSQLFVLRAPPRTPAGPSPARRFWRSAATGRVGVAAAGTGTSGAPPVLAVRGDRSGAFEPPGRWGSPSAAAEARP